MELHRNAKLGLSGRFALVQARAGGLSVREAARRFSVSPATVSRWSCRWRAASEAERRSLSCLLDRSSRPRRMPRLLSAKEQRRICAVRRQTVWGPRLLTVPTGYPHSTIAKLLKRHGLSCPPRPAREPERRYEWPCPGDLPQMDVTLYARFQRPGHALTGDRRSSAAEKRARVGYDYAHAIVDDHSRLAYAELLDDERATTVTAFLERALERFAALGIEPKRADDRQRLGLHQEPLAARAAGRAGHPPLDYSAAPPAYEREGRALPSDDGPGVGIRPSLSLLPTPRGRPATLAALLQRTQTAQLAWRPTSDQPRSQRLWAGQLDAGRSVSDLLGLAQSIHRLIDGQENRRLERTKRTAASNRQRNRGHGHIVGCLPQVVAVVIAERVPEPVELPTDRLDVLLRHSSAVLRVVNQPGPRLGRVAEPRQIERHRPPLVR